MILISYTPFSIIHFPYILVKIIRCPFCEQSVGYSAYPWEIHALPFDVAMGSALGAALKAAYLAGESPAPGIAYLPG